MIMDIIIQNYKRTVNNVYLGKSPEIFIRPEEFSVFNTENYVREQVWFVLNQLTQIPCDSLPDVFDNQLKSH